MYKSMQNWFNPPINTYGNAIQNSYPVTGVQNPYTANVPTGEQLLKVNGIDGAKAFLTRPNSQVALFDANDDIMYIKTTDAANYPVIRKFKFVEVKEEDTQNLNYVTTDDLAKFKEEVLGDVKQFVQQRKYATNANADAKSKRNE